MGRLTEHILARTTTVMLSGFHASAGPLKETAIHFEERQRFSYDGNLDICQPTHYMTKSTCIDDDSEREYDDHDDASLPDLQPSVYEICVITHYCPDCPVRYQESDQLPVQCQLQFIQQHFLTLDQLPSTTKDLILAASDTLSTLSRSSQPSHSLIIIHFANGSFAESFLSRLSFSTGRSLLIEKSDEFLRSQSIFKLKRQDQRKSAALTESRPTVEKSGKTGSRPTKSAAVTGSRPPSEKSGKTPQSQNVFIPTCQDRLKSTEGPTDVFLSSVTAS
jgi:hypothetical protein